MKRSGLIAFGLLIILLILGMWLYLFLNGAPTNTQEVFTNLGITASTSNIVRVEDIQGLKVGDTKLAPQSSALQQLTTNAVAGFGFSEENPNIIAYVERGTGYIYTINMSTGIKEQISVVTIPQTTQAVFSPNIEAVAITVYTQQGIEVSVGTFIVGDTTLRTVKLPRGATNLAFKDDATLYFTLEKGATTVGYIYSLKADTESALFTAPFADARMLWSSGSSEMYIQTKPSQYLEGYIYNISNGRLSALPQKGLGLSVLRNRNFSVASQVLQGKYLSSTYGNGATTVQPLLMLPEKCVFDTPNTDSVWCASPLQGATAAYVEQWYKGIAISQDELWYAKLSTQQATLVGNLFELSGRVIDVTNLTLNTAGTVLLFSNKIDQTLWLYRVER